MELNPEEFRGELRLGRRFTSFGLVSAGGLGLIFGILLLMLGPTLDLMGPQAPMPILLTALVIGQTLLVLFELLGPNGQSWGTYPLVNQALGGVWGFLSGWGMVSAALLLNVLLLQAAAEHLLSILPPLLIGGQLVSLLLLVLLIAFQVFGSTPRAHWSWRLLLGLFAALLVLVIFSMGSLNSAQLESSSVVETGNFTRAAAWAAIAYLAIETVLSARRQASNPGRLMPRALIGVPLLGFFFTGLLLWFAAGVQGDFRNATHLADMLTGNVLLPAWLPASLGLMVLLMAANVALLTGARQIYALTREGALPKPFRAVRRPFRQPPLIFALWLLVGIPLLIWGERLWLLDLAAGCILIALVLLNVAAIRSRKTEPDRQRMITLPFYPVIPAVSLAILAALLVALAGWSFLSLLIWLGVGAGYFYLYARPRQVVAQKNALVFSRQPLHEKEPRVRRILLPLSTGEENRTMLELAAALARQMGGEVIALQVIPVAGSLAIDEGRRTARERNTLFEWSMKVIDRSKVRVLPITRLSRSVADGILETAQEDKCDLILLSWVVRSALRGARMGSTIDAVVRRATCDLAVVAFDPSRVVHTDPDDEAPGEPRSPHLTIDNILVPTAGGPHAPLATELAVMLAREYKATTRAVYVADAGASPEALASGEQRIASTLAAVREQELQHPSAEGEAIPVESVVVSALSIVDGIVRAAADSDLVLIGASNESLFDQVVFGTVPEQVAAASPSPVVMVKHYLGLPHFWLRRLWQALFSALPTLSAAEQTDVYVAIRRQARPDIDFFVMIGLSAVIATFGLLQGSGAVIIGAMLVAPLFTPILGLSLAVARGDIRLLRVAAEATIKGIPLAVGLGVLITAISPLEVFTGEIISRSQPNLFDLAVALASGAAGAYAVARKDVAASLPGVAIAAALVPPLGVVGIGLATGHTNIAQGATLLFSTNLIAIVLSGAITLLLLGFRPTERSTGRARQRLALIVSLALLLVISIPLGVVFFKTVNETRLQRTVKSVLEQEPADGLELQVIDFAVSSVGETVHVEATAYVWQTVTPELVNDLQQDLSRALNSAVFFDLVAIPVDGFHSSGE